MTNQTVHRSKVERQTSKESTPRIHPDLASSSTSCRTNFRFPLGVSALDPRQRARSIAAVVGHQIPHHYRRTTIHHRLRTAAAFARTSTSRSKMRRIRRRQRLSHQITTLIVGVRLRTTTIAVVGAHRIQCWAALQTCRRSNSSNSRKETSLLQLGLQILLIAHSIQIHHQLTRLQTWRNHLEQPTKRRIHPSKALRTLKLVVGSRILPQTVVARFPRFQNDNLQI